MRNWLIAGQRHGQWRIPPLAEPAAGYCGATQAAWIFSCDSRAMVAS